MKVLTWKMHRALKLVTVAKEPRKGLQTSRLFNSTGTKQHDGMNCQASALSRTSTSGE